MSSKSKYDTENRLLAEELIGPPVLKRQAIQLVARGLYNGIKHRAELFARPSSFLKNFSDLSKGERNFWYDYAAVIPFKFRSLGLLLRSYSEFCKTCIITEEEISLLVGMDLDRFGGQSEQEQRKILFLELNYLIPAALKEAGYEVIRSEELTGINLSLIKKISRAIHSRYLNELRKKGVPAAERQGAGLAGFDNLPAELQLSNMDNAAHIPTKLLSIGYRIRPVQKGFKSQALHLTDDETETMARVEHLRWSWEKRLNGWAFSKTRDDKKKLHPGLVPYDELDENEKEKDKELVRLIPAILHDIEYEAYPVSPNSISKLSYAIKPRSSIHKLLHETTALNNEIMGLASSSPEIMGKIRAIDEKISQSIGEVQGSYNYARDIQKAFLPEDLSIRECFPDSFVLFEPKDVISGDFYLFSRQGDNILFALADCTGHGIPAALISTIGYGILDQAVNIMRITDPAEALRYLYSGVHRFLRRSSEGRGVPDDMDIILCNLNTSTGNLDFSGTGNALLHLADGRINEIRSGNDKGSSDEYDEYTFVTQSLHLNSNDALYLCSDGYADQLGGNTHKRYTRKRLVEFLTRICALPMTEQGDRLYEEFERWREEKEEDQTDDITIIGIRV